MLKFNNNHIFTGYLKQLLSSFNLPMLRVYTREQAEYAQKEKEEGEPEELNVISTIPRDTTLTPTSSHPIGDLGTSVSIRYVNYLRGNTIQNYVEQSDGTCVWQDLKVNPTFVYNQRVPNRTRHLVIKDNIYDSYTHEYLGDYLRFQRDYNEIDLMSLYNCFSNRLCNNLYINYEYVKSYAYTGSDTSGTNIVKTKIVFDSQDPNTKVYMLPVKFFKKYTIALDSNVPVEFCCTLFGKYQNTSSGIEALYEKTYKKVGNMSFNQPYIYDKLEDILDLINSSDIELATKESDLKLLIKIPALAKTSIVVLEGDYTGYNDKIFSYTSTPVSYKEEDTKVGWKTRKNTWTTNYEEDDEHPSLEDRKFVPIGQLQLLSINNGVSYPFADRLIEYLMGNVITHLDPIGDDIQRVQTVMEYNNIYCPYTGVWSERIRPVMYDFMNQHIKTQNYAVNHDLLGYVDKDVEKYYYGKTLVDGVSTKFTISNVDIYSDMWNKSTKESS